MHCCVRVDDRVEDLIPLLRQRGVHVVEDEPMMRMGARGMGLSIYITDPDGYVVELKEEPE
jgi:catechol 2,3-dioxygenase-like lactoylglutathione lyase family enzyme